MSILIILKVGKLKGLRAPLVRYLWTLTIPRGRLPSTRLFPTLLASFPFALSVFFEGRSQLFRDFCFSKQFILETFAFFLLINILFLGNFWIDSSKSVVSHKVSSASFQETKGKTLQSCKFPIVWAFLILITSHSSYSLHLFPTQDFFLREFFLELT